MTTKSTRSNTKVEKVRQWQRENKEKWNAYQRKYNQRRRTKEKAKLAAYDELVKMAKEYPSLALSEAMVRLLTNNKE